MSNEDRIRKWKEQRETRSRDSGAPEIVRTEFVPSGRIPSSPGLEEARQAIRERRELRWRSAIRRLILFVAAPVLAVLLYIGFFATPLYDGDAVFTVQTSGSSGGPANAGLFMVSAGNSTIADAFKARAFILSRPMMEHMQKRYGFLDHFSGSNMDPLARFDGPFGLNQDPFRYYLKRVNVSVDVQEGILRLHVQARTQEDAIRFGNGILAAAERHVNASSDKIGADQIDSLTRDVQRAEMQVGTARRSLASVQARRGDFNPAQTATAIYQLISNLELQLSEAERQRDALRAEGLVNSPMLPGLETRVRELRAQIGEQRGRLTSPGGDSVAGSLTEFETASSRKDIAQARWQSTLDTLQQAYLQVLQQRRYFVLVVGMSASTFAKVRDILSIAAPLLLLIALIYLGIFAARRGGLTKDIATMVRRRTAA
jgi:capsular polysaccharide transport system permease protein